MNHEHGMVQILKVQDEIDRLLKQGYTKVYIYKKLIGNKEIKLGKKRFYEILRSLDIISMKFPTLHFPGQRNNITKQSISKKEVVTECRNTPENILERQKSENLYLKSKNVSTSNFQQLNKNPSELV